MMRSIAEGRRQKASEVFARSVSQLADLTARDMGGAVKFAKTEIIEETLVHLSEANGRAFGGARVVNAAGETPDEVGVSPGIALVLDVSASREDADRGAADLGVERSLL